MLYSEEKNAYETTLEYENGNEQSFDIPSLRGRNTPEEGMKPINNKDGLMDYKEK